MIDSDAIEDKCGICKGDGTECSPVKGEFIETVLQSGKFLDCARNLPYGSHFLFCDTSYVFLCSLYEDRNNTEGS